jgi:hypothetical protein
MDSTELHRATVYRVLIRRVGRLIRKTRIRALERRRVGLIPWRPRWNF